MSQSQRIFRGQSLQCKWTTSYGRWSNTSVSWTSKMVLRLKPQVKQEFERRGVQELSKAMIMVEYLIELIPSKDKFESSKPKKIGSGREDEGQVEYSDGNCGNEKPQNSKKKPNNMKEKKRDDKLEKTSMKLGLIMSGVEAKRVKGNEKKPVKCFLCCGSHSMQDYPEQSKLSTVTKEDEAEPEKKALKLGSMILNSVKAKRDHK
ncbi:hypothetical protein J1N35_017977 [Gossypium stocksii]|uniref:Uncharacterized protein n=1 Tax=Gossypium stocksii TaxID=47602 RepID=A0A9D3VPZ2_9ROSI|nr:hypothetical protein J1N35_017977 [Gossypium stocksii]